MLKNYFTVALRNLLKNKIYSAINVVGFSIGLSCTFLITLYVQEELSYDRYHAKAEEIYRVSEIISTEGVGETAASMPIPVGPTLKQDFPNLVKTSTRFFNFNAPSLTLEYSKDKRFNEQRLFFTDPDVFKVFSFSLLKGNKETALNEPNTIVLTQAMASKYFGKDEPMGKVLRFEDKHDLKVTGVVADVPTNSHFKFDFLASFATLKPILTERQQTSWYWNPCWTYLRLADHTPQTRETLSKQFPGFVAKYFPEVTRNNTILQLQPLTDIYLHSNLDGEIEPTSNIVYVYIFSVIGMFILFIASINFMNLTTARSVNRAKEVGVRKVLGSQKQQLILQFLGESVLLSMVAFLIAIVLVVTALPVLNAFSGKHLVLTQQEVSTLLPLGWLTALGVGLLSGLYPAFYMSSFKPLTVLKGNTLTGNTRGALLRKTLVVLQFSLSILLIIGTVIAYYQLEHLRNANLGFNKEQVMVIPINRSTLSNITSYENFKNRLLQNTRIRQVTAMEEVLGKGHNTGSYMPESRSENIQFSRLFVREDFTQTFGISLLAGRSFTKDFKPDPEVREVLINEALVKYMGWQTAEAAVGKRMGEFRTDSTVIITRVVGVVKDFHVTSLHENIRPFVIEGPPTTDASNQFFIKFMAVRVSPGEVNSVARFIEKEWNSEVNDRAFEYTFLDENLNRLYQAEARFGGVTFVFTLLAIFIACLGLFGLATFTAEQRTKEIGIRKVLGASVSSITLLLSKDFLKLVLLSIVIASPLAYYTMYQWLENFAYRIEMQWWMFALAGLISLLIALFTISFQSIKAALANPVKSLRNE